MWVPPRMRRRPRRADADRTMASPMSLVGLSSGLDTKAGTKLADVVTQINASEASPVYAAAVAGRLVLSSRTSGSTSDFAVAGTLAPVEDATAAKTGDRLDALYLLDGDDTPRRSQVND